MPKNQYTFGPWGLGEPREQPLITKGVAVRGWCWWAIWSGSPSPWTHLCCRILWVEPITFGWTWSTWGLGEPNWIAHQHNPLMDIQLGSPSPQVDQGIAKASSWPKVYWFFGDPKVQPIKQKGSYSDELVLMAIQLGSPSLQVDQGIAKASSWPKSIDFLWLLITTL